MEELRGTFTSIASILVAMAALAALEAAIPLRARGPWSRAHLAPNLALTFLTFALNAALGAGLALALAAGRDRGLGLLPAAGLPAWAETLTVLVMLDLSFYVAHRCMHGLPSLWRFHRVHHSDPAVDVTTTARQHPGETLIRYPFTTAFALLLGASPEAFLVYRSAVALFGLLEHANLRIPRRLDSLLALAFTWPTVHKVHHSRDARLTDTNFGNLLCVWDRLLGTFTPAAAGRSLEYGLAGLDEVSTQTTLGLLRLPFLPRDILPRRILAPNWAASELHAREPRQVPERSDP